MDFAELLRLELGEGLDQPLKKKRVRKDDGHSIAFSGLFMYKMETFRENAYFIFFLIL